VPLATPCFLRLPAAIGGRGGRIRTGGLLAPIQALYQAELRPEPFAPLRKASRSIRTAQLSRFLAGVAGFEPATYGFGDRRSTKLSYTPGNRQ
jgi:hypothetical protein